MAHICCHTQAVAHMLSHTCCHTYADAYTHLYSRRLPHLHRPLITASFLRRKVASSLLAPLIELPPTGWPIRGSFLPAVAVCSPVCACHIGVRPNPDVDENNRARVTRTAAPRRLRRHWCLSSRRAPDLLCHAAQSYTLTRTHTHTLRLANVRSCAYEHAMPPCWHAHTYMCARPYSRTHARTHARTHVRIHACTHSC